MTKRMLIGLVAGALLFSGSVARADTLVLEGDVPATAQPNPLAAFSSGSYHFKLFLVSEAGGTSTWRTEVRGNNDGNPPTAAEGVPNPAGGANHPTTAKAGVNLITMTVRLTSGLDAVIGAGGSASTNAYNDGLGDGLGGAAGSNLGGQTNESYGDVGGAWLSIGGGSSWMVTANPVDVAIAPRGGNQLDGTIVINAAAADIASVDISLQDNGQQWRAGFNIVPEPATMTLAAVGLAPLAGLLKRRRRTEAEEAEETESA
jgi:hypothetical protein